MKKWFFRTFLADALIKKAYGYLDDFLTQKYPKGWPRVQFAMQGWVTKLGVIITSTSLITLKIVEGLREGGHPEEAIWLAAKIGLVVIVLGLARKALKWAIYEEAIDGDGWLDDLSIQKPEGFDENEKAVILGKLDAVKKDLSEVADGVQDAKVGLANAKSAVSQTDPTLADEHLKKIGKK